MKNEIDSQVSTDFKPCNCRKSKCLKLYCECFSNGRKCTSKWDCSPCCNTPLHEGMITQAKEQIINRNPDAFKPKFNDIEEAKKTDTKKHQRGCNCQKSGCLKKYWECYQMNAECSDLCRCIGWQNWINNDTTKESKLGKRKRVNNSLKEVNLNKISQEHSTTPLQPDSGYYSKPRRAKENRSFKNDDFSVEIFTNGKV
jgi:hypothetical protein